MGAVELAALSEIHESNQKFPQSTHPPPLKSQVPHPKSHSFYALRIIIIRSSRVARVPTSSSHRRASCVYPAVGFSSGKRPHQYRLNRPIISSRVNFASIDASATGRCEASASGMNATVIARAR